MFVHVLDSDRGIPPFFLTHCGATISQSHMHLFSRHYFAQRMTLKYQVNSTAKSNQDRRPDMGIGYHPPQRHLFRGAAGSLMFRWHSDWTPVSPIWHLPVVLCVSRRPEYSREAPPCRVERVSAFFSRLSRVALPVSPGTPSQYREASGAEPNRWDQVGGVRQRPSTEYGSGRDLCSSCTTVKANVRPVCTRSAVLVHDQEQCNNQEPTKTKNNSLDLRIWLHYAYKVRILGRFVRDCIFV